MLHEKKIEFSSLASADLKKIKRGFNIISPVYNAISTVFFGKSLINSQTHFIPKLKKAKSVLILGGGTGQILLELMKSKIGESYYYLDVSEKMIDASKRIIVKNFPNRINEVTFDCGSYQNISNHDNFDLIITPYVLDCFSENKLKDVICLLNAKLDHQGQWLFVDFNISKKSVFSEISSRLIIKILYSFFNIFCKINVGELPNFPKIFMKFKLETVYEKKFLNDMLVGRIYEKSKI